MNAKEIHAAEQMFAAIAQLAATSARYYLTLLSEGVPAPEALALTANMQAEMIRSAHRNDEGSTS